MSTQGTPLQLADADKLAERIAAEIIPFCERLDIAGSIRRRRPVVGDIDIVVLPKHGQEQDILTRCKRVTTTITGGRPGQENHIFLLPNGVQIDLFIAKPERASLLETVPSNYGSLLLCRTGSVRHNIWLIDYCKRHGRYKWNPHYGLFEAGLCVAAADEQDIFRTLSLDYVPPENREL